MGVGYPTFSEEDPPAWLEIRRIVGYTAQDTNVTRCREVDYRSRNPKVHKPVHRTARTFLLTALVFLGALLPPAVAMSAAESALAAVNPRPSGQFAYGTHLARLDHAQLARDAGFDLMWGYVSWQQVEPTRNNFLFGTSDASGSTTPNPLSNVLDAANKAGMQVILRLDGVPDWAGGSPARLAPADLEAYVYQATSAGHGAIQYVEVFNEQNLPDEWGGAPDPAAYVRLLAAAYHGAKRADSRVQVISAAPSQHTGGQGGSMEDVDWLAGLYRAGGSAYFDLLGMHAYVGNVAPETEPRSCTVMCFRDVDRYRSVMERNGDGAKSAFITEMGTLEKASADLGAYAWMELAPDLRADYLIRALQLANGTYPWIRGAMVFNFDFATMPSFPQTSERIWFSLLNADGTPRPALGRFEEARHNGHLS